MELENYYDYEIIQETGTITLSLMRGFREALNSNGGKGSPFKEWMPGRPLPNPGTMHNDIPITSISHCFSNLNAICLDLSLWDTSGIFDMMSTFSQCKKLRTLDLSNWNLSKVVDVSCLFLGDSNLSEITFGKDLPASCRMQYMLYGCPCLEALDISNSCIGEGANAHDFDNLDSLRFVFVKEADEQVYLSRFLPEGCRIIIV